MKKHSGKNFLITGGSRGIGAGIVKQLAEEGARVAFTYTSRPDAAEEVLAGLPGEGHFHFKMDISDESSIVEGFKMALEKLENLNGLVNNAGITRDQILMRMKTADFDDVIQTNLRGTFLCTKSVLKTMMKARSGSVVSITSVIGQTGNAGQANYAASKAGVEAFTKSMAQEVGSRGLRFNCVAPGFIQTEMTEVLSDDQKQSILNQIPLQHLGSVEDIAHSVSFLLSDEARYISGQTLAVNGGMYM